jgi:hypothetical protein
MSWLRRFSVLGLTLLLGLGVSCTTNNTSPTEVPVAASAEQPAPSFGLIGDLTDGLSGTVDGLTGTGDGLTGTLVGTLGQVTDLLTCSPQPYAVTVQKVGPKGGKIVVGTHTLEIPKGALFKTVIIKAEQITGSTNSVRFSPEGLGFEKRPKLTMSYENCAIVLLRKKIVYTDESLKILEVLRSLDLFNKKTVSAPIDHFSRYAVAW